MLFEKVNQPFSSELIEVLYRLFAIAKDDVFYRTVCDFATISRNKPVTIELFFCKKASSTDALMFTLSW